MAAMTKMYIYPSFIMSWVMTRSVVCLFSDLFCGYSGPITSQG